MATVVYRWARLAANVLRSNAGALTRPYKLIFIVTKRCHSRCTYCDIWKVKDDPAAMAAELTLTEIDQVARANSFLQWIDFTGGEPTDRPDFVEVVRAFAEHCPNLLLVHFPTNGLATRRIIEAVAAIRQFLIARLVITVSIDGPPAINDVLRGVRNDFAHAMRTFAALRAVVGDDVYIGMTLHGHTGTCGMSSAELMQRTFEAINEHLSGQGERPIDWAQFHVNLPHLSEHYYHNARTPQGAQSAGQREEIAEALRMLMARNARGLSPMNMLERIYRGLALRYLATGRTPIRCGAIQSTVYLSEHGTVFPCSIWNKPLGNVRRDGFALGPILDQARAAGVRRAIVEGKCPQCWTPCEAYPAIAGRLAESVARA